MILLSGNSNKGLAEKISKKLGVCVSPLSVGRFSDGETFVEIKEKVRGQDVFLIQSTSFPANETLMDLLVILDALRRASPKRITTVIPYFGYARQDRKSSPRTPITAKLVANIIQSAGADRVLSVDLHAQQLQGFFDIPVDMLYSAPVFVEDIKKKYDLENTIILSPDVGAVTRSRQVAKRLNMDMAIIDKRRERAGISQVVSLIGDVKGKHCIICDDIVDTAGTLCNAATKVLEKGALSVSAYVSHGVLSGGALPRIENSVLKRLVVTDSVNVTEETKKIKNIEIISLSNLIADAIFRIHNEESVSSLLA